MTRATSTPMPGHATRSPDAVNGTAFPDGQQPYGSESGPDFIDIQNSAEFRAIRRRLRRFVFPVSVLFLCWYLTYVLLAAYAHDFMSQAVFGHINMGLVLGLLQFVSTMMITTAYAYYMRRDIDPRVDRIRSRSEGHRS